MCKKFKMIVTDLDGTLLTENKQITQYTLKSLQRLQLQKAKFAIVTAKSENVALPYMDILKPDIAIYNNGALIKSDNYVIFEEQISKKICCDLIRMCMNYHIENIRVVTKKGDFSNAKNICVEGFRYTYNDYSNFEDDAYKISFSIDESIANQIAVQFKSCSMQKFAGKNSFIFTNINATKEMAVKRIATWCGVSIDKIVAFGDDLGDIGMLKACGIGIAVANAQQKVKDIADDICNTNDNDGIAKWLNQNINFM